MKRYILGLLIAISFTMVFVGCGNSKNNTEENNAKVEKNEESVENEESVKNEDIVENEDIVDDEAIDEDKEILEQDDSVNTSNEDAYVVIPGNEEATNYDNKELVLEYARELGSKYYDYEINTDECKKINNIELYHFVIYSGPPNNEEKEYMLGDDGYLYDYAKALDGILEIVE